MSIQYCTPEILIKYLEKYINIPSNDNRRQLIINTITNYLFDKSYFLRVLDIYRDNSLFSNEVWKYSFYHIFEEGIKEYFDIFFDKNYKAKNKIGAPFSSQLINIKAENE